MYESLRVLEKNDIVLWNNDLNYDSYPSIQVATSGISEYYTNIPLIYSYSLMPDVATWIEGFESYFTCITNYNTYMDLLHYLHLS